MGAFGLRTGGKVRGSNAGTVGWAGAKRPIPPGFPGREYPCFRDRGSNAANIAVDDPRSLEGAGGLRRGGEGSRGRGRGRLRPGSSVGGTIRAAAAPWIPSRAGAVIAPGKGIPNLGGTDRREPDGFVATSRYTSAGRYSRAKPGGAGLGHACGNRDSSCSRHWRMTHGSGAGAVRRLQSLEPGGEAAAIAGREPRGGSDRPEGAARRLLSIGGALRGSCGPQGGGEGAAAPPDAVISGRGGAGARLADPARWTS